MSGTFTIVAPASMTASNTVHRKLISVRPASSAENSTSSHKLARAFDGLDRDVERFAAALLNLYLRWMSLVARKVWIRGRAAPSSASQQRSMSAGTARARPAIVTLRISRGDPFHSFESPSDAIGNPASMMST